MADDPLGLNPTQELTALMIVYRNIRDGKLASYSLGDRTITLHNLNELWKIICVMQNAIVSAAPTIATMTGPTVPQAIQSQYPPTPDFGM